MAAANGYRSIDWDIIRKEVVAGQLSIKEIARRHGCSDTAIRKKSKNLGWERNLAGAVREQVRNKLVREVRGENARATNEEVIDAAAERGASVVRSHRADITSLRTLEQKLLEELGSDNSPPTKVHITSYLGIVTQTVLGITVTERIAALQALANAQHKRIQLERQAYNLDEDNGLAKQTPLSEILAEIDGQARDLPSIGKE